MSTARNGERVRSDRQRVAIIGAGIGAEHLQGWLASPERFEVAIICDLDAARAAPLVERARACGSDARFEIACARVIDDESIDIVDVCLPPRLHKDAIIAALARCRHVVCEKPLVASLAEWDEVVAAAEAAGCQVMPVFQYRFGPGLGALCRLVERGLAGTPLVATLETHWNRQADYYANDWRGRWETELGGAVVGHAIHIHDLVSRVLGPVASVQASLATRVNPVEVEDCGAIILTLASGARVTSSITLGAADDRSRLRFCFSELTVESGIAPYAPATGDWRFLARGAADELSVRQDHIDRVVEEYSHDPSNRAAGFSRQFVLFDEALQGRGPLPVTLDDARASLELITAIYAADASGERVHLPLSRTSAGYADWRPGKAPERASA